MKKCIDSAVKSQYNYCNVELCSGRGLTLYQELRAKEQKIEKMRERLQQLVMQKDCDFQVEEVLRLSGKLDLEIAEYLRLKQKPEQ